MRRPRAAIEAFRADCLHRRHRLVPHRLELLAHHLARVATDEIFTVWFVTGAVRVLQLGCGQAGDFSTGKDFANLELAAV